MSGMTPRTAAQYALMWGIRYAPAPWYWKQWAIHRATPRQIVVGLALIPDAEGRILMLRARYSGGWLAPGGAVHPGEDPLSGARRECREELGLEVEVDRLSGVYTLLGTPLMFLAFRCAPLQGAICLSPEHETYRYLPRTALPAHLGQMVDDMLATPDSPLPVRALRRPSGRR